METVSPISWRRLGASDVRTLSSADLGVLQEATAAADWSWRSARPHPPFESWRTSLERADLLALVLERETQVRGAVLLQSGDLDGELGRHPWSQLEQPPRLAAPEEPPCETLLVEGLGWLRRGADTGIVDRWIDRGLTGLCQRLGAERIVASVRLEPPPAVEFSPATHLQQIQFQGLSSHRLAALFRADFELRGFHSIDRGSGDEYAAAVVWENARL